MSRPYQNIINQALNNNYQPDYEAIKALVSINGVAYAIASFYPKYGNARGRIFDIPNEQNIDFDKLIHEEYKRQNLPNLIEIFTTYVSMYGFAGLLILDGDDEFADEWDLRKRVSARLTLKDIVDKPLKFAPVDPLALRPVKITTIPTDANYLIPKKFRLNGDLVDNSRLIVATQGIPYYLQFNNASISFTGFSSITRVFGLLVALELIQKQMAILAPKVGTPLTKMDTDPSNIQSLNNLSQFKARLNSMGFENGINQLEGEDLKILSEFGLETLQNLYDWACRTIAMQSRIQRNFLFMEQTEGGIGDKSELVLKQHADSIVAYQYQILDPIYRKLDKIVFLKALARNFDEKEVWSLYNKYVENLNYTWNPVNVPNDEIQVQMNSTKTNDIINLATALQDSNKPAIIKKLMLNELKKNKIFEGIDEGQFLKELEEEQKQQQASQSQQALPQQPQNINDSKGFFLNDAGETKVEMLVRIAKKRNLTTASALLDLMDELGIKSETIYQQASNQLKIKQIKKPTEKQEKKAIQREREFLIDEVKPIYEKPYKFIEALFKPIIEYSHKIIKGDIEYSPKVFQGKEVYAQREARKINDMIDNSVPEITNKFEEMSEQILADSPFTLEMGAYELAQMSDNVRKQVAQRTAENLALIKSINTETLDKIINDTRYFFEPKVLNPDAKLSKDEYDTDIVKKTLDTSQERIDFIARDQTAKLQNSVEYYEAQEIGAVGFIWKTMRDIRVSGNPSGLYPNAKDPHYERADIYYSNEDLSSGKIELPGTRPLCRCYAKWIYDEADIPSK